MDNGTSVEDVIMGHLPLLCYPAVECLPGKVKSELLLFSHFWKGQKGLILPESGGKGSLTMLSVPNLRKFIFYVIVTKQLQFTTKDRNVRCNCIRFFFLKIKQYHSCFFAILQNLKLEQQQNKEHHTCSHWLKISGCPFSTILSMYSSFSFLIYKWICYITKPKKHEKIKLHTRLFSNL